MPQLRVCDFRGMVAIGSLDHAFGGAQDACDITRWCSRDERLQPLSPHPVENG
jgi:hypothetical protein